MAVALLLVGTSCGDATTETSTSTTAAPTTTSTVALTTSTALETTTTTRVLEPPRPDQISVLVADGTGINELPSVELVGLFTGPGPESDDHPPREYNDFDISAGPESVLAVSNYGVALYDKAGELHEFLPILEFFRSEFEDRYAASYPARGCEEFGADTAECYSDVGDGEIRSLFDPESGRFFVVAATTPGSCTIAACESFFALAVSRSPTPMGLGVDDWFTYSFGGDIRSSDGIVRGVDFTEITVTTSSVLLTCQCVAEDEAILEGEVPGIQGGIAHVIILPKEPLINGTEPETVAHIVEIESLANPNRFIAQAEPVIPLTPDDRLLLLHNGGGCAMEVVGFIGPIDDLEIRSAVAAAPGNCISEFDAAQGADAPKIHVVASNLGARPILIGDSLWGVQIVDHPEISGTTALRWFEIDIASFPNEVSFVQSHILAIDGLSLYLPALMVGRDGEVMMVFGGSGEHTFPSLFLTGRLAGDPEGTMRAPNVLAAGQGRQFGVGNTSDYFGRKAAGGNYGDYFGIALDPTDGSVWAYGEFLPNDCRWASVIAKARWETDSGDGLAIVGLGDLPSDPINSCGALPPPENPRLIFGTATSASGTPLSEYYMFAHSSDGNGYDDADVDAQGRYVLEVIPGEYLIEFRTKGNVVGYYSDEGLVANPNDATLVDARAGDVTLPTIALP